jgi:hypothetical protein
MGCQCISLWCFRCECFSSVREAKPVYILTVLPLCMRLRRSWYEASVHPVGGSLCMHFRRPCGEASVHHYNGAVVYAFIACVMGSHCTSLWWCRRVCISTVRDVKPVYILMIVPMCMHFSRALCEACVRPLGSAFVYPFPTCLIWIHSTSIIFHVLCSFPPCVMRSQFTSLYLCRCVHIYRVCDGKPLYILKVVSLCMYFSRALWESSVHCYGIALVFSISDVRHVKLVYILM